MMVLYAADQFDSLSADRPQAALFDRVYATRALSNLERLAFGVRAGAQIMQTLIMRTSPPPEPPCSGVTRTSRPVSRFECAHRLAHERAADCQRVIASDPELSSQRRWVSRNAELTHGRQKIKVHSLAYQPVLLE